MATILSTAAQAAHSAATAILGRAPIQAGATIPSSADLKENGPEEPKQLDLAGKNLIVGVPGAFTATCSRQIPAYIEAYDQFKANGVNNIYVISVNDVFVMKAWKENLAPGGTGVQFIADDKSVFTSAIGMLFDATARLGGPRSKRYVIVVDDGKASSVVVEDIASNLTVTDAKAVLAGL